MQNPMSMSTFGLIAHTLRPSNHVTDPQNAQQSQDSPQTVTGNSYSVFTTKNYGNSEMHWFWMVLICALLFAWWKLCRYCKCPGPSKEDRRNKRQAKWYRRQLEEIEEKISRYERKLEDIRSLRSSLGLESGANSSALSDSRALRIRTAAIGGICGQ